VWFGRYGVGLWLSYHIWGGGDLGRWVLGGGMLVLAYSDFVLSCVSVVVALSTEANGHDDGEGEDGSW